MTETFIIDIFSSAAYLCIIVVTVIVLPSMLVGLVISVFQAATQINEQTLSFLPRLVVMFVTLVVLGPWIGSMIFDFSAGLIHDLPELVRS